jgi:hypothetical protein
VRRPRRLSSCFVLLLAAAAAGGARPLLAADPPPPPPGDAAPAPRVAFDRPEHDFGVAAQQTELRTQFTVRNEGTAPLRILDVRADCGCGAATVETHELEPGASTPIQVTLRTLYMAGVVTKRVIVRTDDPARPVAELRVRADVSGGIVLDPAHFFFGDVPAGTRPSATIRAKWKEGVGTPFEVKGVESPGLDLDLEAKPWAEGPWKGFEVRATFRTAPPVGRVSGQVVLRTDRAGRDRIDVPVQAQVSGRVWVDRREVTLGMVPTGQGRETAVICRPFRRDTDLGQVTAASRKGRVTATAIASGREWVVTIRLPSDAPPGPVEDVVEVRSEIPGEPPAEVKVTGYVSGGRR